MNTEERTKTMTTCSHCPRPAVWAGLGDDGDSYCDLHLYRAPGDTYRRETQS